MEPLLKEAKKRNPLNFAGCPNSLTDLSLQWTEVHHIVKTRAGDFAV